MADGLELRLADPGIERQREPLSGESLRHRKVARGEAKVPVRGRKMCRFRVVAARLNSEVGEMCGEPTGVGGSNHVEVPDRLAALDFPRKQQVVDPRQSFPVELRSRSTLPVPLLEQWEFLQQDDCLNRVESGGVADELMVILARFAMHAQRAHTRGDLVVVRDERTRIAEGAEVLGGIEAESGRASELARAHAFPLRAVRLACVLDDL